MSRLSSRGRVSLRGRGRGSGQGRTPQDEPATLETQLERSSHGWGRRGRPSEGSHTATSLEQTHCWQLKEQRNCNVCHQPIWSTSRPYILWQRPSSLSLLPRPVSQIGRCSSNMLGLSLMCLLGLPGVSRSSPTNILRALHGGLMYWQ